EYDKGSYVVLEASDIAEAASENKEMIVLEAFVDQAAISPAYLEKPYVLVPGKKAEKGYVLLREVLKKSKRVGVGRVVIRTREYLSMVIPQDDALMLILMRFPQELVDTADYKIPEGGAAKWKITPKEMEMAQTLLESMAEEWKPDAYKDEFRERLTAVIKRRIKAKGATTKIEEEGEHEPAEAATNVVDFMALLQQSLKKKAAAGKGGNGKGGKGDDGGKTAKKSARAPAKKATKAAAKTAKPRKQA
ncbi:MAG: Ku protein, partial [Lysobacter sp.]